MTMKLANEMSFKKKISFAFEDLNSFSNSCKEKHDASRCNLDPCFVKFFCDELFSYTQKRRRSLGREKSVFLDLCIKYSNAFDHIFTAVRHKKFFLEYFKENNEVRGNSC